MKKVQDGAVIVALNRLARTGRPARPGRPRSVFRGAPDLIVRLNLVELTYANSARMLAQAEDAPRAPRRPPHVFLTVTRGIHETTIIASRELRRADPGGLQRGALIARIGDLASVTVLLPPGTALIPGVYSYILKALAWEGVNVVEVVSTLNEFTIVLGDRDIDRGLLAHQTAVLIQTSMSR